MAGSEVKVPFDPEGTDYDYDTASQYGIESDDTGHWQSRVPETGLILKGRNHPTFSKTIQEEIDEGYEIYKNDDGRYYSRPSKNRETSLPGNTKLSIDDIMSSDFSVETLLDKDKKEQRDSVAKYAGTDEVDAKMSMSAFLENLGIYDEEEKKAQQSVLMAMTQTNTSKGLWENVKGNWDNGYIDEEISRLRFGEIMGTIDPDYADKQIAYLKSTKTDVDAEGFNSWVGGAVNIVPGMVESVKGGVEEGVAGGITAAAVAGIAGQAGPQVALPEEAVTVPGAFIGGYVAGSTIGSAEKSAEQQAGLLYDALKEMTDEEGNHLDPAVAKALALSGGGVNGLLDLAQIGKLAKTLPGAKGIMRRVQMDLLGDAVKKFTGGKFRYKAAEKIASKVISSRAVKSLGVVGRGTAKWAGVTLGETGIEALQEFNSILSEDAAGYINNKIKGTDMQPVSVDEVKDRLWQTTVQSLKSFGALTAPGSVINITAEATQQAKVPMEEAGKAPVSPITYISQIITSDITEHQKIESRLDIGKLGRVMVEPEAAYPGIMAGDIMAEEVTTQDIVEETPLQRAYRMRDEAKFEAKMAKYRDDMTGLGTKKFDEDIGTALMERAGRENKPVAYLYMDANWFKAINEVYSHDAGDEAISIFGQALRDTLRGEREGAPGDIFGRIGGGTASRLGGEEFGSVLYNVTPEQANMIKQRVEKRAQELLEEAGLDVIKTTEGELKISLVGGLSFNAAGEKKSISQMRHDADMDAKSNKDKIKKERGEPLELRGLGDLVEGVKQKREKGEVRPKLEPQKPQRKQTQKPRKTETPPKLTPEEEYQLIQSEATFAAEAPFEITPELYIGNMTQRAKNAIGASFGVDPSQVRDFLDGAWPTKRTKITLRMDESRALLIHMEASLQDRVDNNKIHTEKDLWQANADWGDIKELRHKLGLPVIQCPFRVIRGGGTKTILIENTKERIEKTTKAGALDIVEMTRIKHLNDVMARVAKYAREGFAAGKKEAREAYALLQYLRKQKQMREALMEKITAEPGEGIHVAYRKAIADLQNAFDWEIRREEDKVKKEALKKQIEKNETLVNELPAKLLESLTKKDAIDLSYMDLLAVNDEINRLKQLGKLKSRAYHKLRAKALEKTGDEFTESVKKSRPRLSKKERFWSLRPSRIFDMIDSNKVKSFTGAIYNFFYNETNDNYNAELETSDTRLKAGANRREELGIKLKDLTKKRTIEGIDARLTLDEMLTVYTGWMNPENRAALEFGGMEITGQKKPLKIDQTMYDKIFNALTGNEKMLGDTILAEYAQNAYDRLRNTKIVAENKDMGNTENYTPMQRVGIVYDSIEAEVDGEFEFRKAFRQAMPEKGFTIDRRLVPPEYQTPIKSGLVKQWMQMVRKHEHYIANVQHIKDMRSLMKQDNFRKAIVDKFGEVGVETINHYIDGIANPDFYRNYNDMENLTRTMRKHAALAYIAYNLSSLAKQIPALASYWANSSIMDIVGSSINAAIHPMQSYERAKQIHYQVSHQSIEREMVELQRADANAYEKIIGKVGRTGMYGIFAIDRAIRVIGINAVYAKSKRNGMGELEARQAAAKVTLMTQEAASPKDLARIYSTNEFLNVFLMFTNQLNQIYNISTYDIPEAFRNGSYREAVRSTVSLAAMALMIWMIDNQEVPDEPEEFADAISDQFISSLPLVGGWINSSREGWKPSTPPQSMAYDTTQGIKKLYEGDVESGIKPLLRSTATGLGLPYVGAKEAYEFIEEQ